jgi:hypothetical protein
MLWVVVHDCEWQFLGACNSGRLVTMRGSTQVERQVGGLAIMESAQENLRKDD